jgi:hypothetical protein
VAYRTVVGPWEGDCNFNLNNSTNNIHGSDCSQHEHVVPLPFSNLTNSAFMESTSVATEYPTIFAASTAIK